MTTVGFIAIAGLVACSFPALAQSNDRVQANIPFAFQVGTKMLPAGSYDVLLNRIPGIVILRNTENHDSAAVITNRAYRKAYQTPSLVFERYGERHFLAKVWPFDGTGFEVPKRTIDNQIAKLQPRQESPSDRKEVALKTPSR